jgi:hypothetical protein
MMGEMLANWDGGGGDASTFQGLPWGMDTFSLVDCGLTNFMVTGKQLVKSVVVCKDDLYKISSVQRRNE